MLGRGGLIKNRILTSVLYGGGPGDCGNAEMGYFFSGNAELTIFICGNAEMAIMNGSGMNRKLLRNCGIDNFYLWKCGNSHNERKRNEPKISTELRN